MSSENQIRDRIAQNDVTVMRSYLEVDFAEWLSNNEVPFGYEPFTIPSIVGPGTRTWQTMVEAVRSVGQGEFDMYDQLTEDTRWDDMRPAELQDMWQEIYDKHRLQDETIFVPVRDSLAGFDKRLMLPDFTIYPDASIRTAGEDFNWGEYSAILEVSGLWGVGLPGESTQSDWWDWYRVSAVAFKEFAYKLLGLWDKVYWVLPNQGYDEATGDGIPKSIRNDDHYFLMNTTQTELKLGGLEDKLGITAGAMQAGLSPPIVPTKYNRPLQGPSEFEIGQITKTEYTFDSISLENIDRNENAVALEDNWVVFHGELGEVYLHSAHAHVREAMWRKHNMVMMREYILDVLRQLQEDGIVDGLSKKENGGE